MHYNSGVFMCLLMYINLFMYDAYVLYLQLIGCVSSAYVIYLLREKDDTSKYQLKYDFYMSIYTFHGTIPYPTTMPLH